MRRKSFANVNGSATAIGRQEHMGVILPDFVSVIIVNSITH
jgi:hypothetical protein